ncbi:START domain-containing protein [uncultured Dokdonia sp.]|uniref:START domain-containing protein n=1 Tax=uncultured Dokdonia sp. TaxID=575653 RepID=UPI00260CD847|nr:START domain-containing protein [uncultured Dokdonia sp.]
MKTFFYLTFFMLLPFGTGTPEKWKLKKSKDNIEIYTRAYPDSPFKEFKATSVIETTFEALLYELYDAPSYTPACDFNISYRIPSDKENSRFFYYKQEMPWPLKDRDVVTELKLVEQTEERIYLSIETVSNVLDIQDNCLRIEKLSGFWLLEKEGDAIRATQQIHMDPGGRVPAIIVNPLIVKGPFKTFTELHRKLDSYKEMTQN